MAEQFVRVALAEGDEGQLAGVSAEDYVEFAGTINGAPVPVRFYRADPDAAEGGDGEPAEPVAGEGEGEGERIFEVAVTRSITCTVRVAATDGEDAYNRAMQADFPLPPRDEWTGLDDWHVEVTVDPDDDKNDDGGHSDGDGCAIYTDGSYVVLRLHEDAPGGLMEVRVEDLEGGDEFVEHRHGTTVWEVEGIEQAGNGDWHVDLGDSVGERPDFSPPECVCPAHGMKPDLVQDGNCGRTWCDRCTPTPAARCPYENEH